MKRGHMSKMMPAALFASLAASAAGFAVATAADAGANVSDMPCPGSVTEALVIEGCLPSTDPSADSLDMRGPNQVPEVNGIPCTGSNTGTCIGLSRLPSADAPEPDTSVQHSP